jgi:hypothetical protein
MQLKPHPWKVSLFAAFVTTLVILQARFEFRIVNQNSPNLALAAFGYSYQGAPLTGLVLDFVSWHQLRKFVFVFEGTLHGPEITWYDNGQRWTERHYYFGQEHGVQKAWYPNGQAESLKNFDHGVAEGDFFGWYQNGILSQYVKYENGREIVAKTWTGGGKPFYNYVWNGNNRIGLQGDRFCSQPK